MKVLTIGGERVPGLIAVPAVVEQDDDAPDHWRVTVTFLTNVFPDQHLRRRRRAGRPHQAAHPARTPGDD
ncbi:hypothetical protein GS941_02025 [Rhodococcus hoagii]|nr:hypothetical protein [Prescottella equi]